MIQLNTELGEYLVICHNKDDFDKNFKKSLLIFSEKANVYFFSGLWDFE